MSRRTRIALRVAVVVALLLLVVTAWQVWVVRSALLQARSDLQAVSLHLADDDQQGALQLARTAQDATARADLHSHTPVWWAAQVLPFVGDDVTAVRTVSAGANDLAEGVVTPVIEAGFSTEDFKPVEGRLQLEELRRAGDLLGEAAPRVAGVGTSVSDLDTDGLLSPVRGPVEEMQDLLTDGARLTRAAAVATELLPGMLGDDGPRRYLLAFQNNAELRSSGGLVGTLGVLEAEDGKIDLVRTFSPGDLENGRRVAPLSDAELELFRPRMALLARNATATPDFPRSAQLLQAFWDRSRSQRIDGVIAIDPVALSYLLEYTGDIELSDDITLTPDNAVDLLLSESYELYEPERQDEFFAEAATAIFDKLLVAQGPVDELVSALDQGIRQRRIAFWSNRDEQQSLIAGEAIANELSQDPSRGDVGVYLIDQVPDKLGYYLRSQVDVESLGCDGGVQELRVSVALRSTAPPGEELPSYVVDPVPGAQLGTMVHNVLLVAPVGGEIEDTGDGASLDVESQLDQRPAGITTVQLAPGESAQLEYTVVTGADQGDVRVATTPLADGTGGEPVVVAGCED